VSYDGDTIGREVGRARLSNDVEYLRRISQSIDRGNKAFEGWAIEAGGSVVESGGDEGLLEVPASALTGLESVRSSYKSIVGATVSVGIGNKVSDSSKALMVAKLRGKDKVCFYEPDMEKEITEAVTPTETEKLNEEYLAKSEPVLNQALSLKESFIEAANEQERRDRATTMAQSVNFQQLKGAVANVLQQFQPQLENLALIQQVYPDTANSILELINTVIALGRGIGQAQNDLNKAMGNEGFQNNFNNLPPNATQMGDIAIQKQDIMEGGAADRLKPEDFDQEALAIGTQRELEHTNDFNLAQEIAMDHLAENPDYYFKDVQD